jgi:tRNA threonylcarbamoyladenosine biosynthesis protein TsaE
MFISRSPDETAALGEAWGREVQAGWVLALTGGLGAGKTQLVRGLARGLGSPARVHSPTFVLLHIYDGGRLPLHHLDLYRLAGPEELMGAGLDEYLYAHNAVTVVEWAERWLDDGLAATCPGIRNLRRIQMLIGADDLREIHYEDSGA